MMRHSAQSADYAARAFPFLLLALLAVLAYWLDRASTLPEVMGQRPPSEPDLIMTGFHATAFDADGSVLHRLKAVRATHYRVLGRTELDQPELTRTLPGTPLLTINGAHAILTHKGNEVEFDRDVQLHRAAAPQSPPLTARTTQLWVDTRKGFARSSQPALVWNDTQRLAATGFDYDHKQALLRLHTKVRVEYAQPSR